MNWTALLTERISAPVIRGEHTILDERVIAGQTYRIYRLEDVNLEVFCDSDEMMPYWADIWPSGLVLARLLGQTGSLDGVRMLELGCGLGFPSIVAASLGARVTATDQIPEALDLLQTNARMNGVEIETRHYNWLEPEDIGRFDVVVAADVLYEPWQVDAVPQALSRTLAADGHAVVVDPDRKPAKRFPDAATYRGFKVVRRAMDSVQTKTPVNLPGDTAWSQPVSVYDITWREFPSDEMPGTVA